MGVNNPILIQCSICYCSYTFGTHAHIILFLTVLYVEGKNAQFAFKFSDTTMFSLIIQNLAFLKTYLAIRYDI